MNKVEFWFEFASTYSYPAAMRIESLAAEKGVKLIWRPFLLGPLFKAQGWADSPFNMFPAKGEYMWRDLQRICETQGIAFQKPTVFPRNGLLAARIACSHCDEEWLPNFVRAIYQANFACDLDISSTEVVSQCLGNLGLSPSEVIVKANTTESKVLLRSQTEEASKKGIFGAPSVLAGDELFWGNDRLEAAMDWITAER